MHKCFRPQCAFAKLAERAAQANMTPEERADYEESLKNYRDYYSTIDIAVEMTKRKAVAKMYAKGYPVSEIAECNDMTEQEVMKIIQTLS